MKLLSQIPALIAKLGNSIEPIVTSDLEVAQAAFIQLPVIPYALRGVGAFGSTVLQDESTVFSNQQLVGNGAALLQTFRVLSKGIWRVNGSFQYSANYTDRTLIGFQLRLNKIVGTSIPVIASSFPSSQTARVPFDYTFALDEAWSIEGNLGANGVGQEHAYVLNLSLSRLF